GTRLAGAPEGAAHAPPRAPSPCTAPARTYSPPPTPGPKTFSGPTFHPTPPAPDGAARAVTCPSRGWAHHLHAPPSLFSFLPLLSVPPPLKNNELRTASQLLSTRRGTEPTAKEPSPNRFARSRRSQSGPAPSFPFEGGSKSEGV
ncbi:hypothetical protein EJB05_06383, partial [Eragrostis curvula]